jgi:hypothetical protein
MEERDGHRSCRDRPECPAVRMKQQACVDRLTPTPPAKGNLSIPMMLMRCHGSHTDTAKPLRPGDGRSVPPLNQPTIRQGGREEGRKRWPMKTDVEMKGDQPT